MSSENLVKLIFYSDQMHFYCQSNMDWICIIKITLLPLWKVHFIYVLKINI